MNIAIYRILDLGAKDWPPHAGDRPAQRHSIRSALQTIRWALACDGGHVHIASHGVSVHYATRPRGDVSRTGYTRSTLSGYSLRHNATALAAMAAGVPYVDTRPIGDIGALLRAPLIACGSPAETPPWGPMSYAPLQAVFAWYREHGARTGNERDPLATFNRNDYSSFLRRTA